MKYRRKRGTAAQELGKSLGGTLSMLGSFICLKAMFGTTIETGPGEVAIYSSLYFGGTGDLFAPFDPDHVLAIKWIALLMVIGGTVLRLVSYWNIKKEGK